MKTILLFLCALLCGCAKKTATTDAPPNVLRVGFLPNVTYAAALIGYHETATKGADGWFEKRLGVKIEWYAFNAGPSVIEALLAGSIDIAYVGQNPVLNGYTRTKGKDIRVLSGATRGGALLVVQKDSPLKTAADFRGRKIATPQLGNTQDVAARAWLKVGGLAIRQSGGDAYVIPTQNADLLDLFKRKELDAAWAVEPWVSRLELEADAQVLVEQKEAVTALLASSVRALDTRGELVKKFIAAHEELTAKIAAEPDYAKPAVIAAFSKISGKPLSAKLLDHAWPRLTFTTDVKLADFLSIQQDAKSVGLLPLDADLGQLFLKP